MTTTQSVIYFFLLSLGFGTQMFSPVVDTKLTGVGFYKLGSAIVLGCLILAVGIHFFSEPVDSFTHSLFIQDLLGSHNKAEALKTAVTGIFLTVIGSHILTYFFHKDVKSWSMWGAYGLQMILMTTLIFITSWENDFSSNFLPYFFLSSALLGISHYAMLLGHYYLVVPKLSEEPLIYCLNIFWIVIFLKIVSTLSLYLGPGIPYLTEGSSLGDGYMYNWLFVSMRFLWGFVAPLILSFFTYRLCRMRSIQSATGVLYIIEFFVIVGELISLYLKLKHQLA